MNIFAKIKELEERLDDMEIIENEYIEPVETGLGTELIIKNQPTQPEEVENGLSLPMPVVDVTDYSAAEVVFKIQVQTAYEDVDDIIEHPGGYLSVGKSAEVTVEGTGFVYYDFSFDSESGNVSNPDADFKETLVAIQSDLAESTFHCLLASVSIVEDRLVILRRKFDNYLPIVGC